GGGSERPGHDWQESSGLPIPQTTPHLSELAWYRSRSWRDTAAGYTYPNHQSGHSARPAHTSRRFLVVAEDCSPYPSSFPCCTYCSKNPAGLFPRWPIGKELLPTAVNRQSRPAASPPTRPTAGGSAPGTAPR